MGRTRALLTETDRRYIAGEADVDDSKRYQAISRVRDRLEELEKDIVILEEHHPDLHNELREIVCPNDSTSQEGQPPAAASSEDNLLADDEGDSPE